MRLKSSFWRVLRFIFLGFFVLISIGPLLWIIMSSFKSNREILSSAFSLPTSFSFSGYTAALDLAPIFQFYGNSIIISVVSTVLNVLVVSMAAYVLARHKFKGNTFINVKPLVNEVITNGDNATRCINDFQSLWYANVVDEISVQYPLLAQGQITPEQFAQALTDAAAKN